MIYILCALVISLVYVIFAIVDYFLQLLDETKRERKMKRR